jgi:hypothetical protein
MFILPGPIIVGDCLSIITSHILLGLGTIIPAIFVAIDWQFSLLAASDVLLGFVFESVEQLFCYLPEQMNRLPLLLKG